MTTSITVVDERAPVEQPELTRVTRLPLGGFVAYNGLSADGQRRRAFVVEHGDDAVTLQDGPERVTVSGDDLDDVVVLANSADGYAQRVSQKARDLTEERGWCDVGTQAIEELNSTPEEDPTLRNDVRVAVTTTTHYVVRPRSTRSGRRPLIDVNDLTNELQRRYYVNDFTFAYDYVNVREREVVDVQMKIVDAFTPNGDAPAPNGDEPTASPTKRRVRG